MVLMKKFNTIKEIQLLHKFAQNCIDDIGIHSESGDIIVDAKSIMGIFSINYEHPVKIVTENEHDFKTLILLFKDEK